MNFFRNSSNTYEYNTLVKNKSIRKSKNIKAYRT